MYKKGYTLSSTSYSANGERERNLYSALQKLLFGLPGHVCHVCSAGSRFYRSKNEWLHCGCLRILKIIIIRYRYSFSTLQIINVLYTRKWVRERYWPSLGKGTLVKTEHKFIMMVFGFDITGNQKMTLPELKLLSNFHRHSWFSGLELLACHKDE